MREIQTEIRRDHIENDNRKNELQSKAQSGLKTAETNTKNKQEDTQTISKSPKQNQQQTAKTLQSENNIHTTWERQKADTMLDPNVQQADAVIKASHGIETAASNSKVEKVQYKSTWDELSKPLTKEDFTNLEPSVQRMVDAFKEWSDSEASMSMGLDIKGAEDIKKGTVIEFDQSIPKEAGQKTIQNQIKHDDIENSVKRDVIQNKAEGGIKTKKGKFSKTKGNAKVRIAGAFKAAATVGTVTSKIIQSAIPSGGDDLSSESASKIKETAGDAADKSFEAIRKLADKKAKSTRKASKTKGVPKINGRINYIKKKALDNIKKPPKAVGKVAGVAIRGVSSSVGTVQKFKSFSSNGDMSGDLAEQTKATAEKAAEIGFNASKKVVKAARKPAKAIKKKIKSVTTRTVKTAVKKAQTKAIKTTAKTSAKAAKRTVKTSVNAAKTTVKAARTTAQAAKVAVRATVNGLKAAAHAIKAAVQATIHAAQAVGHAVVALMSTPVGWIILGVVLVVVLIVILFNMISGAATAPVSVVSGVGSSLSWLFGGDDSSNHSNDDIADLYYEFEPKAIIAMGDARTHYQDKISEIDFGERDTLEFNESLFYPASSADEFLQNFFDNLTYSDYPYLIEICYIKKLRDERAAQGLSDRDIPEITLEKEDILNFLIEYCYEFEITIIEGQSCPPADCQEEEELSWCFNDADCPDVVEEGDTCPGHTTTYTYCDNSHIKAVVTIKPVPKDILENDILMLTYDEREMLELALSILYEEIP